MNWDANHIKALALDLDGTILRSDGSLSSFTQGVLGSCAERGIRLVICTGRSMTGVEPYRALLKAQGPMVYFNGAAVLDMPGGGVLKTVLLGAQYALACLECSRRLGVYLQVFVPGGGANPRETLMVERMGDETEFYRNRVGLSPRIGDLQELMAAPGFEGCFKAMFIGEPSKLESISKELSERFDLRSGHGRITLVRTYRSFLEVMAAGVSKGAGLGVVMERCGLGPGEVIAIGDEENDIPLFARCYSAAPANARAEVRAKAELIIGSNDEDGPGVFLRDFFGL